MLINDTTFLLDEAISSLKRIHEIQEMKKNESEWNSKSAEQKEELDKEFSVQGKIIFCRIYQGFCIDDSALELSQSESEISLKTIINLKNQWRYLRIYIINIYFRTSSFVIFDIGNSNIVNIQLFDAEYKETILETGSGRSSHGYAQHKLETAM